MSKILSIDYGTKNIGLAMSDDEQKLAFSYKKLVISDQLSIIRDIKNVCQIENVKRIVIGLPINLSGAKTATTQAVLAFITELRKNLTIPIETVDERLSTVQAYKIGANKKSADEVSAQILLQGWLDKSNQ